MTPTPSQFPFEVGQIVLDEDEMPWLILSLTRTGMELKRYTGEEWDQNSTSGLFQSQPARSTIKP